MRQTTLLTAALVLPALAAHAQPAETCIPGPQGTTSDCVVDSDPPVIENFAEGEFITQNGVSDPADTGVIAADESLLEPDEETFAPDDGLNIEVGGVLEDSWTELDDPDEFGLSIDDQSLYYNVGPSAVRVDPDTREILEIRPFTDPGLGPQDTLDDIDLDTEIGTGIDTGVDTGIDTGVGDDPFE